MSTLPHFIISERHRLFNITFDPKTSKYVVGQHLQIIGHFDITPDDKNSILVRITDEVSIKGPDNQGQYEVTLPLAEFELFENQVEQGLEFIELGTDQAGKYILQLVAKK